MAWPMPTTSGIYLNRFLTLPECLRPVPSLVWVNSPWPVSQERGGEVGDLVVSSCRDLGFGVWSLQPYLAADGGGLLRQGGSVLKVTHPCGR